MRSGVKYVFTHGSGYRGEGSGATANSVSIVCSLPDSFDGKIFINYYLLIEIII